MDALILQKPVYLLIVMLSFCGPSYGQKQLKISHAEQKEKALFLESGDHVEVKYFKDSTRNSRARVRSLSGKIIELNDSLFVIKKYLTKKTRAISFEKVYRIRKETAGRYVFMATPAILLGVASILFVPIHPLFISLSMLPPVYMYDLLCGKKIMRYPVKFQVLNQ